MSDRDPAVKDSSALATAAIAPWTDPSASQPILDRGPALPLIISSSLYLRVLAAILIVWFHTPGTPGRQLVGPGLMVFLCLSFMQAGQRQAFWPTLRRRTRRLMLPWAAWWLIYAAARFRIARGVPTELTDPASIWTLLIWPSAHLWYLPFVYFNGMLVQAARHAMTPLNTRLKVAMSLMVGMLLLLLLPLAHNLPQLAGQWWVAMPTIGIGVAYGYALRLGRRQRQFGFAAVTVVVWLTCLPILAIGRADVAFTYAVGALLMLLCVVRVPRHRMVTRLASLTLGVYLVHPLAMFALWKFLGADQPYWVMLPATVVLSFALAALLRRMPYTRAIV